MAGIDVATRVVRDSLAMTLSRPVTAVTDAGMRPSFAARREAALASVPQVLAPTTAGATVGASSPGGASIPSRVQATLASDRALFTVLTAGRQSITAQANLMASQNAQGFLPFTALFGSGVPMPAMPTTPQTTLRRKAAQAADRARVQSAYADPRGPSAAATSGPAGAATVGGAG